MGDRALGVASSKADIDGGTINNAVIGGTTPAAGSFTAIVGTTLTTTGNAAIGDAITDTIGFYGTTPTAQRALAAQNTTLLTTASSTAIDTLTKAALIEIMDTLKALGLWKGAA